MFDGISHDDDLIKRRRALSSMKRSELFFNLPKELIAQEPSRPRDACRLMVLDRQTQTISHQLFFEIETWLRPGDVLVFNDSKVLPARLLGTRGSDKREVLLLRLREQDVWEVLVGGKVRLGDVIAFSQGLSCTIIEKIQTIYLARFNQSGSTFFSTIQTIGFLPTPPYIKKPLQNEDDYQTIYADVLGSAAAPTAGLHFTQTLLDQLKNMGVEQEFLTLHVGLGTFQPVKTAEVEKHQIHSEWYQVELATFERLKKAKAAGNRIVAVGTTSVRVLETLFQSGKTSGESSLFIYPGYTFQAVDALVTNFHTPYSSLLALVYAFSGTNFMKKAYGEAITKHYRFFSFGDAMLIL